MLNLPIKSAKYATNPVPSLEDFENLWTAWDIVTRVMIPQEELLSKPIKLRNCLVFYLGHIPTFLGKFSILLSCSLFYTNKTDIHVTRATRDEPTKPKSYPLIFERGIDPDVDNPEHCHSHSELPDEWPPVTEILEFQENVRNRVRGILKQGKQENDRTLSEALWLGFEHEAMHLETFLYMLLQTEKTQPPPGVRAPDFELLASQAKIDSVPNEWFTVPEQRFSIGLDDDPSANSVPKHSFGWDNEKPSREVNVPTFSAHARPITNGEYATYLEKNRLSSTPASWVMKPTDTTSENGAGSNGYTHHNNVAKDLIAVSKGFLEGASVRTVFGFVPLKFCLDWPVMASYDELSAYAKWTNCRIPSFEEAESLYKYSEELKSKDDSSRLHLANGDRLVKKRVLKSLQATAADCNLAMGPKAKRENGMRNMPSLTTWSIVLKVRITSR